MPLTFLIWYKYFNKKWRGFKLVSWAQTSPLSEMMRSFKYFPYVSKIPTVTYNRTNETTTKNAIILNIMHNIFNLHDTELKVSYALYWFYQREPIKQQSTGRHVAPLNLIPRQSSLCSFTLNAACLAETQQIPVS
jgi:hypothetical protein